MYTVSYPAVFPNTSVVGSVENFNTLSSQKATYLATEPAVLVKTGGVLCHVTFLCEG
jgi:hypothetical protein